MLVAGFPRFLDAKPCFLRLHFLYLSAWWRFHKLIEWGRPGYCFTLFLYIFLISHFFSRSSYMLNNTLVHILWLLCNSIINKISKTSNVLLEDSSHMRGTFSKYSKDVKQVINIFYLEPQYVIYHTHCLKEYTYQNNN